MELTSAQMGKTAGRTGLLDGNHKLRSEHVGFEMPERHPRGDTE